MQLKRQHKHSKFCGNLDQILIQLIHMESSFWPYWFWKILHASFVSYQEALGSANS